ncbi:MAG: serine/threonine protein kinase, partial [Myxococcota bacterium]|nr:serine/threonine protein kinase [Myxococcota bacterium]
MGAQGQLAGRTIGGRYEVLDLIGIGGMGEVYRARDRELDEIVALKVIREQLVEIPGVLEQFRSEVKLARRVTHRNVARAYEMSRLDGLTFYTMELIEGVSLTRRLGGRPTSLAEVAEVGVALCDALAAAHEVGVIHRDLKPDNVMIGHDGRIVLTDFGIAAAARAGGGGLKGTPRYMAPEQARGEPASPGSDLYALGVVLQELITGVPAFTGNVAAILDAKQRIEQLELPELDPRFVEVITRATSRDPARRPRSAVAMRRSLAPFARGLATERHDEPSLLNAQLLPTVVVRWPRLDTTDGGPQVEVNYLVDAFYQALIRRLSEWPRLRVLPRVDVGIGAALVELTAVDEDVAILASIGGSRLELRQPLDSDALVRSAEQSARVLAAFAGSESAPPPLRGERLIPEALDLVLRARYMVRCDRSSLRTAIALCERARLLAPGHPRVLAALAQCEVQLTFYAGHPEPGLLRSATEHAFAAIAADPDLAEAHLARGHIELHRGHPVAAAACFRAAI